MIEAYLGGFWHTLGDICWRFWDMLEAYIGVVGICLETYVGVFGICLRHILEFWYML
jgi:hypothetical protein